MTDAHRFRWFVAGQSFWFAAFGMQTVMFPFLVVNLLGAAPERVGIAQMCLMAPAIALMVPGGMLADASDIRALLARLQFAAMLPAGVLAWQVGEGSFTFALLVGFALMQGSVQALVTPTRDALLGRVASGDLQRAITLAMGAQFLAQMAGFAMASTASTLGPVPALAAQAILYGCAALCALRLPAYPPVVDSDEAKAGSDSVPSGALAGLREAFTQVLRSSRLLPVTLVMVGVGLFFISVFNVLVPLMVRDLHDGGAAELALVNASFVSGVLVSTVLLGRRAAIHRQGAVVFLSACAGVVIVALFALAPPQWLFYTMILVFGIGAGVLMSLTRTVVQQAAVPRLRARVLAIYNVAFLGAAPLGSFTVGQVAERLGVLPTALVAAGGMAALLALLRWRGGIWQVTAAEVRSSRR